MKLLHKSSRTGEFHIIKTLLENQGIDITVKNEDLHSLSPLVGFSQAWIELWVNKDTDYAEAEEILQKHLKSEPSAKTESWKCKKCGEIIEGQFTACWKCEDGEENTTNQSS